MVIMTVAITCPNCWGKLQMPQGRTSCFCTYCGTQVALDDGSMHVHLHTHDEAELKRIELEQQRQTEVASRRRVWVPCLVGWLVVIAILLVATNLLKTKSPDAYNALNMLSGFVLPVGDIALFVTRPGKRRR